MEYLIVLITMLMVAGYACIIDRCLRSTDSTEAKCSG